MVICFFGDSLVLGVGDPEARGWVGRLVLDARPDAFTACYNLGVRRNATADIQTRWRDEAEHRRHPRAPMRLVFAFGAVDMSPGESPEEPRVPLETALTNARAILTEANAHFPTLMISPPPTAEPAFTRRIESYAEALGELCHELGVPYLNILPELLRSELYLEELVGGDGIHPGAAGYAHIFRLVNAWSAWRGWVEQPIQTA